MFRKIIFGSILHFIALFSFAQDVQVKGYFLEDSIKIGEPSPYVLTARYPSSIDLIFPDSLYNYNPYELGEKWFAATKTIDEQSYDSALYYILSFEVDSVQYLQLPVFQVAGRDSIPLYPQQDSIILTHLVKEIPDSVAAEAMPLIENTTYRYVDLALNYPYLITGIVLFIILVVIGYIVFGKSIKRWFKLRRLEKKHLKFMEEYNVQLQSKESIKQTEKILLVWKKYLEKLEKTPYTKMTTKELLSHEHIVRIGDELKSIDKAIYGGKQESMQETFKKLLTFAENRYLDKVNEVKHG
ncbi:hypothetical protein [Fulvivirga lutea]|uniref:Oxygen tolerance n=1 Tax=Fulvivirga lutea TaxID=2810512 RepID=A0A974WJ19_9BACT|nr:hypothetical protein [Fulvivirga lutea]QSE99090.1 hypothetical protein JR347_08385 [Fulvivirga lutea]